MRRSSDQIKRCQPADAIIKRCGGYGIVAEWLRVRPSTVQRWTYEDGTAGMIPPKYWPALLKRAKASGVDIAGSDLLPAELRSVQ